MNLSELQRSVLSEASSIDTEWIVWEDWYPELIGEPPNSIVTRLRGCGRPNFATFRALSRRGLLEGRWMPNLHVRVTPKGREAIS
jgi:hypothetical protein